MEIGKFFFFFFFSAKESSEEHCQHPPTHVFWMFIIKNKHPLEGAGGDFYAMILGDLRIMIRCHDADFLCTSQKKEERSALLPMASRSWIELFHRVGVLILLQSRKHCGFSTSTRG